MRPKTPTLTPQELEIMKIVWERKTATVRDAYETLRERRKIAYTTVMTVMKILEDSTSAPTSIRLLSPRTA
jgi:predicted transcriptional regulator